MSTRNNLIVVPFRPSDDELLFYLKRKLDNSNCNSDPIVDNVNVFNYHPQELAGRYMGTGENVWYFLTPNQNGSRPDHRTVANKGFWKSSGGDIKIFQQSCVGTKMVLVFYEGSREDNKKTNWIMREYRIEEYQRPISKGEDCMKLDDYVLTKIRLNECSSRRNEEPIISTNRGVPAEGDDNKEQARLLSQLINELMDGHMADDAYGSGESSD